MADIKNHKRITFITRYSVSEMTYTVSSGTLNSTIPYNTIITCYTRDFVTFAIVICAVAGGEMLETLENTTAENSSADEVPGQDTGYTTETAAFFDPAWQLAISIELYFRYAIIAIGIFGTAANALVLYGLVAYHVRETKKWAINLLTINQNLLDLSSCVLLIITYSTKVSNIHLTGALGYFLCTILHSENAHTCTLYASIINLTPTLPMPYLKWSPVLSYLF